MRCYKLFREQYPDTRQEILATWREVEALGDVDKTIAQCSQHFFKTATKLEQQVSINIVRVWRGSDDPPVHCNGQMPCFRIRVCYVRQYCQSRSSAWIFIHNSWRRRHECAVISLGFPSMLMNFVSSSSNSIAPAKMISSVISRLIFCM